MFYRSAHYFLYCVIYSPGWFTLIAVLRKCPLFPVLCDLFTWLIPTNHCFTEVPIISCTVKFIHLADSDWSLFYRSGNYFLYCVIYSPSWFSLIAVLQKCPLFPVLCDLFTQLILTDRCFTEVSIISCTVWFIHPADSHWLLFYRSVHYFLYCVIYLPGWFPLFPVLCDLFTWLILTDPCFTQLPTISCTVWFIHPADSHWSMFYTSAHYFLYCAIYLPGWLPLITVLQKCPLFPVLCDLFTQLILTDRCFTEVSIISDTVWFIYLADSHWSLFYRSAHYFLYCVIYSPSWFPLIAVLQKCKLFPVLFDLFTQLILTDRCFTQVPTISCTVWCIYPADSYWSLFYRSAHYFLYCVIYSPSWFSLIAVLHNCPLFPVLCDLFTQLILTDPCFTQVPNISCTVWFIHLADSHWLLFYRSAHYFLYCVIYSPGWFSLIAVLQKCPLFPVLCDLFTQLILTDCCFTEVSIISCTVWLIYLADYH